MQKVIVTGASGLVGHALIEALLKEKGDEIFIIALGRGTHTSTDPRVEWRTCDLFSLKDALNSLKDGDVAYYLVHSMLPSSGLVQGTFYDFDLILADNFARAARKNKVQKIIYLGGIIPQIGPREIMSWHLRSRLEVERTLQEHSVPVIALRSGLILAAEGSSFQIMYRLVKRLPALLCPAWTSTRSSPIALRNVVDALIASLELEAKNVQYDLGGPEELSYREMMMRLAKRMNLTRFFFSVSILGLKLSRLWVTVITGAPKNLVYPLVLSLKHQMVVDPKKHFPLHREPLLSLNDSFDLALTPIADQYVFSKSRARPLRDVRSIQRLPLPKGKTAEWVAQEYFTWLPRFLKSIIRVNVAGERCSFYLLIPSWTLLILERSPERSTRHRQLLYIRGGFLAGKQTRGRLEIREVLGQKYVLMAIHDFFPSLPWPIYKYTQALVHLLVVHAFKRHLKKT